MQAEQVLQEAGTVQGGTASIGQLQTRLQAALKDCTADTRALVQRAWLLGPKGIGPNLLLAG